MKIRLEQNQKTNNPSLNTIKVLIYWSIHVIRTNGR
jgi:hypothetical protein